MFQEICEEIWEEIPGQISCFSIYILTSIIYLFKLNALNQILRTTYGVNDPFKIIGHNNNQPLLYLFGAVLLYVCAIFLGYYFIKSISNVGATISIILIVLVILLVINLIFVLNFL